MTFTLRAVVGVVFAVAACSAARAADFVLDDVTMASPVVTYRARRIEATGANLSKEDAIKLLSADNPAAGADRIARIDAERIVIPELVSEMHSGGYTQTFVYRDVVIRKMTHGIAEAVDSSGATIDSRREAATTKGQFGAFHMEGVDFVTATRMTIGVRERPDDAKKQTASAFSMDSMDIELPEGGRLKAGKMTGRNFAGRPLATPMSSLVELAPKPQAAQSDEARAAMAAMSADLMTSVDADALEMNDIVVTKDADARGPAARLSLKRVALDGLKDGKVASFAIEGFENALPEPLRIDRIALAGFDARPTLAAAATATKKAFPQFDKVEIAGVSVAPEGAPVTLGRVVVEAKDWRASAPSSLTAHADKVVVSLAGAGASRAPALAALGYEKLDLSAAVDARFDAEKKEFALNEFSIRDNSIGAARLGAFLGHVSSDLMSGEENAMKSALAAIVFWRADLHVENAGGLDRFIAEQAKATGKAPASVRENLAAGGKAMTRSLFSTGAKPDPRVETVAEAVATFLKGAKTLDVLLSAPDGLGVIDLMMAGRLGSLVDRLKIEAKTH